MCKDLQINTKNLYYELIEEIKKKLNCDEMEMNKALRNFPKIKEAYHSHMSIVKAEMTTRASR